MNPHTAPPALIALALEPAQAGWLGDALAAPPLPGTPAFLRLFAMAGRLSPAVPPPDSAQAHALRAAGIAAPERWPPSCFARAALLVASVDAAGAEAPDRLATALRTSDTAERAAILQALPLLPAPARFADLAADACRSSVQPVFEAVACDNTFPAAHFAEPAFNQMVLKAVFTGAPLARVVGLAERTTPGLIRMAADFRDERRAAGRPVPPDLDFLLDTPGPDTGR